MYTIIIHVTRSVGLTVLTPCYLHIREQKKQNKNTIIKFVLKVKLPLFSQSTPAEHCLESFMFRSRTSSRHLRACQGSLKQNNKTKHSVTFKKNREAM